MDKKVYKLAATCAHVIGWRQAKDDKEVSPVNQSALLLWRMRKEWMEKNLLPSGGGFDAGTTMNEERSSGNMLVFETSFHHMEEGMYTKWTEHTVTIVPSLMHGYEMKVSGRNYNGIKDYIADSFSNALEVETDWPLFF